VGALEWSGQEAGCSFGNTGVVRSVVVDNHFFFIYSASPSYFSMKSNIEFSCHFLS